MKARAYSSTLPELRFDLYSRPVKTFVLSKLITGYNTEKEIASSNTSRSHLYEASMVRFQSSPLLSKKKVHLEIRFSTMLGWDPIHSEHPGKA